MPSFPIFSRNGAILPMEQAVVSLANVEYGYGFGVYETIRVSKGIPYFVEEHAARLLRSAAIIGLEHSLAQEQVEEWVRTLAAAVTEPSFNLKILLIGAKSPEGTTLSILPLSPSFPDRKWYRDGIATITAEYERLLPGAKTLNMLQSYLAYAKARKEGCYDALLIDRAGCAREGTRTNLFALDGETLTTPPAEHVLEGVSRKLTLLVARRLGYAVREVPLPMREFLSREAAFLTSTSTRILPIRSVDGREFPPVPDALRRLMASYEDVLETCGGTFPEA